MTRIDDAGDRERIMKGLGMLREHHANQARRYDRAADTDNASWHRHEEGAIVKIESAIAKEHTTDE